MPMAVCAKSCYYRRDRTDKVSVVSAQGLVKGVSEMADLSHKKKETNTDKRALVASLQVCEASRAPMATKNIISAKIAIATEEPTPNTKIILPPVITYIHCYFLLIEIPYIRSR